MRRFFLWRFFVLSDIDDVADSEVDRGVGGPLETFWHLSITNIGKKYEGRGCHVDLRTPLEVLLTP